MSEQHLFAYRALTQWILEGILGGVYCAARAPSLNAHEQVNFRL